MLKVFAPANVCAPVDTNPGLLALAAANVNVLPLIVPPVVEVLVFEYANVVTPSEAELVVSYNLKVNAPVLSPYAPSVNEIEYPPVFPLPILYSYVLSVAYPDGEDGTGGGQAPS